MNFQQTNVISANRIARSENWIDYFSIQIDETMDDPFEIDFTPRKQAKQEMIEQELRGNFGLSKEHTRKHKSKSPQGAKPHE